MFRVLLLCACLYHVWSSPCLATVQTAPEAGMWSAGLFLNTHSYTHTHTHTVCSPAVIICWHKHTPARGLRGVEGLWVGEQVFWQALGSSPCTLGCLSQTPFLSTQGLLCQVSVTIALCLSLQITNRCPESESLSDIPSRWGWVGLCSM